MQTRYQLQGTNPLIFRSTLCHAEFSERTPQLLSRLHIVLPLTLHADDSAIPLKRLD